MVVSPCLEVLCPEDQEPLLLESIPTLAPSSCWPRGLRRASAGQRGTGRGVGSGERAWPFLPPSPRVGPHPLTQGPRLVPRTETVKL